MYRCIALLMLQGNEMQLAEMRSSMTGQSHLHHELMQALLAGVIGLLLDSLQLALVLRDQPLHLWLQALPCHMPIVKLCSLLASLLMSDAMDMSTNSEHSHHCTFTAHGQGPWYPGAMDGVGKGSTPQTCKPRLEQVSQCCSARQLSKSP